MNKICLSILFLFGLIIVLLTASAQEEITNNLDRFRPDEHSPFFLDQQMRKYYSTVDGREKMEAMSTATYPATKTPDSTPQQLKRFFGSMFQSIKFRPSGAPTTTEITIDPPTFSLNDRREVNVTFGIRNNTNKIMELDFPSSQRVEISIKNSSGAIIEQWSNDQLFDERGGVVMINPDERIEYSEMIPTRTMKSGETYTIEASLYNHPEFTKSTTVTPQ